MYRSVTATGDVAQLAAALQVGGIERGKQIRLSEEQLGDLRERLRSPEVDTSKRAGRGLPGYDQR